METLNSAEGAQKTMKQEEKAILAKYLINCWNFDGSEEAEEALAEAIDKAREADANGRPICWTKTPSIEAEEITAKYIYN